MGKECEKWLYLLWRKGKHERACAFQSIFIEPYPENLPTIPVCFKCNNSFSEDENYMSCYLEILKSKLYSQYVCHEQIRERLLSNPKLLNIINEQIQLINGHIQFSYDKNKFIRILKKLAVCHAGYEFDYVNSGSDIKIWYDFRFNLSKNEIIDFLQPIKLDVMSEISSRFSCNYCLAENCKTGDVFLLNNWTIVQEERYQCIAYFNDDKVCVKMVINDLLFCQATFD